MTAYPPPFELECGIAGATEVNLGYMMIAELNESGNYRA